MFKVFRSQLMRSHILMVLTVSLLIGADAAEDAAKKELAKLQGTWKIVSVERAGKEKEQPKDSVSVLTGNKFATKSGDKVVRAGTLKVDPTQTPKATDVTYTAGPDKGQTLRGIYELDGDTWRICYSGPGDERPKGFPEQAGKAHLILVLKRAKP
jgi:uncharacterized protein (TIGR03067 family)